MEKGLREAEGAVQDEILRQEMIEVWQHVKILQGGMINQYNNYLSIICYLEGEDLEENTHDDVSEDSGNNDAFEDLGENTHNDVSEDSGNNDATEDLDPDNDSF